MPAAHQLVGVGTPAHSTWGTVTLTAANLPAGTVYGDRLVMVITWGGESTEAFPDVDTYDESPSLDWLSVPYRAEVSSGVTWFSGLRDTPDPPLDDGMFLTSPYGPTFIDGGHHGTHHVTYTNPMWVCQLLTARHQSGVFPVTVEPTMRRAAPRDGSPETIYPVGPAYPNRPTTPYGFSVLLLAFRAPLQHHDIGLWEATIGFGSIPSSWSVKVAANMVDHSLFWLYRTQNPGSGFTSWEQDNGPFGGGSAATETWTQEAVVDPGDEFGELRVFRLGIDTLYSAPNGRYRLPRAHYDTGAAGTVASGVGWEFVEDTTLPPITNPGGVFLGLQV